MPQVLKRASSVPTRVPEIVQVLSHSNDHTVRKHHESMARTITPSTTEESVVAVEINNVPSGSSSKEPLLYNSSSSNQAGSQTPDDEKNEVLYEESPSSYNLPKLPGIIPLSGHNGPSGWL